MSDLHLSNQISKLSQNQNQNLFDFELVNLIFDLHTLLSPDALCKYNIIRAEREKRDFESLICQIKWQNLCDLWFPKKISYPNQIAKFVWFTAFKLKFSFKLISKTKSVRSAAFKSNSSSQIKSYFQIISFFFTSFHLLDPTLILWDQGELKELEKLVGWSLIVNLGLTKFNIKTKTRMIFSSQIEQILKLKSKSIQPAASKLNIETKIIIKTCTNFSFKLIEYQNQNLCNLQL